MDLNREVKMYLEYCQYRKELNKNTLKAYRIDLRQYLFFVKDEVLEKRKIEEFITELHKGYKHKTVKRKIASVKAFYKYLEEEEILKFENPFNKIKVSFKEMESLPRIIPKDEIEKLLNFMYSLLKQEEPSKYIYRDLSIVEMFFATGVRVYELSNLKKQDIDLKNGIIRILGKGNRERDVQIGNEDVLYLLNQYYKMNQSEIEKSGYFFVNKRGNRFTEQSVRNMIHKYTGLANLSIHVTPHMFRHSMATYLLDEGVDVTYIQRILGHASIKTTQIYLHVASRKQMEILKQMHPRNMMNIKRVA